MSKTSKRRLAQVPDEVVRENWRRTFAGLGMTESGRYLAPLCFANRKTVRCTCEYWIDGGLATRNENCPEHGDG